MRRAGCTACSPTSDVAWYAGQVERLLTLFPRRQTLFFRTDRLWLEPGQVPHAVQDFIGVERRLAAPLRRAADQVSAAYIRRTAALGGLDLADWLRPDYREPMPAG